MFKKLSWWSFFNDHERLCGCTSGGSSSMKAVAAHADADGICHTWPCHRSAPWRPRSRPHRPPCIGTTRPDDVEIPLPLGRRWSRRRGSLPGCWPGVQLSLGRPGDGVCYGLGVGRCHARRRHGAGAGQRAFRLAVFTGPLWALGRKYIAHQAGVSRGPFRTHISRPNGYNNRTHPHLPRRLAAHLAPRRAEVFQRRGSRSWSRKKASRSSSCGVCGVEATWDEGGTEDAAMSMHKPAGLDGAVSFAAAIAARARLSTPAISSWYARDYVQSWSW